MANIKQRVILKFKDDSFVEQLHTILLSSGKVKVGGLGIFSIHPVKERDGYNIGTGKRMLIPAHNKVMFRPTARLRESAQTYGV